ncbi:MAG: hypothetical protein SFW63_01025 [Alphaproteobacteria bacterium]|nr:hypothetical protein [Alphaproteobacteria bacterium]
MRNINKIQPIVFIALLSFSAPSYAELIISAPASVDYTDTIPAAVSREAIEKLPLSTIKSTGVAEVVKVSDLSLAQLAAVPVDTKFDTKSSDVPEIVSLAGVNLPAEAAVNILQLDGIDASLTNINHQHDIAAIAATALAATAQITADETSLNIEKLVAKASLPIGNINTNSKNSAITEKLNQFSQNNVAKVTK